MNIEDNNVMDLKPGYDYSKLDETTGLIRENEPVTEKTIMIGKTQLISGNADEITYKDESVIPKKGQVGYVDKSFITSGEEGKRIAKIRIRGERIPAIGDKFCSRAGQKGTIGIILDEKDMPTTADGIRPDIIVNPHAMPSRMTIGHLVETITSKTAAIYGGFGNCTAFTQQGPKHELFGKSLVDVGFHSSGNEILYNGMTGEQLETEIYFGPTYYLRLKHMPKDKINYRATGPRTLLTRQTVQGRANNGGLRVGEMDRDCIIAHGLNYFLNESMMVRGDEFYMAICNHSGTIAIYNERNNLFISPFVDGPVKFVTDINSDISIKNVSKFGKDFSVVRVPYAFKLLMQELQAMNIQMRIITEDNVDMLTSLQESDNIVRLTKFNDLSEVANENKKRILESEKDNYFKEINTLIEKEGPKQIVTPNAEQPEGDKYVNTYNDGEWDDIKLNLPTKEELNALVNKTPQQSPDSPKSPSYNPFSPDTNESEKKEEYNKRINEYDYDPFSNESNSTETTPIQSTNVPEQSIIPTIQAPFNSADLEEEDYEDSDDDQSDEEVKEKNYNY